MKRNKGKPSKYGGYRNYTQDLCIYTVLIVVGDLQVTNQAAEVFSKHE
jgi:hypothetical protein